MARAHERLPLREEPALLRAETVTLAVQVLGKLRGIGVDVIEAPWDRIGTRMLDAYLAIKRKGSIG